MNKLLIFLQQSRIDKVIKMLDCGTAHTYRGSVQILCVLQIEIPKKTFIVTILAMQLLLILILIIIVMLIFK